MLTEPSTRPFTGLPVHLMPVSVHDVLATEYTVIVARPAPFTAAKNRSFAVARVETAAVSNLRYESRLRPSEPVRVCIDGSRP